MSASQSSLPFRGKKGLPTTQLFHGDCLDVMPTLPGNSVQMVFSDLPYKVPRFTPTNCHWDVSIPFRGFWAELKRVGFSTTPFVFTAAQPFTTYLVSSNLPAFRYCLVWDKVVHGNFVRANFQPMRNHEDVAVFYEKLPTYNPQMVAREKPMHRKFPKHVASESGGVTRHNCAYEKTYTHRHPRSIIVASSRADPKRGLHPTQKPVALLEWLIRTYTNEGDTVLDPTAGSGTTGVACLRTGRHFIGIEKDATYFAVAQKRIAEERARLEAQG